MCYSQPQSINDEAIVQNIFHTFHIFNSVLEFPPIVMSQKESLT